MRTAEARGTCSPARECRRERNPSHDAARAAGAQLTGQRQSGPSQVPVAEQYPRVAHGGAGFTICECGHPLSDHAESGWGPNTVCVWVFDDYERAEQVDPVSGVPCDA